MSLIVQKYGGSSVKNVERIRSVAQRVARYRSKGHKLVVVVSALGDTTDELLDLVSQITEEPSDREMDMLLSTGEQVSVAILAIALHKLGHEAISFTGSQVGIITDTSHGKARILEINADRIKQELKKGKIVIVAGFQGINLDQDITTLGRGGSDLTAVALAQTLGADCCEIFTDVEGVYNADPRVVKDAKKINQISYDEMLEMASLGAQIMQSRSLEMAKKFDVPIHVRSSYSNKLGTMIIKEAKNMEDVVVRGITINKNEAKITICDVPDRPGIAAKIFKTLADNSVNVDMIVQNVSHTRRTDISFTVPKTSAAKAEKITRKITGNIGAGGVIVDTNIARISIVGVGMKSHPGVAAKMFEILARKKVNIEMISTSEISISCIINKKSAETALKAVHGKFNLSK
ncbi:aspartate kinase [Candidatus Omnitrophota bacterium]